MRMKMRMKMRNEDEFVDDGDCIVGGGGSDQRSGDVSEQQ